MKRKHIIELVIVVIVLAGLLVLMVPHFLKSQQFGLQRLIHNDLKSICEAVQAYSLKYGQFPKPLNTNLNPFSIQMANGLFLIDVETISFNDFQPFITLLAEDGFLKPSIPSVSRLQDFPLHPRQFSFFSVVRAPDKNMSGPAKPVDWGVAVHWPYAAPGNIGFSLRIDPFSSAYMSNGTFQFTNPYKTSDMMIHPSVWFAPSNGLESSGMLYADIQGNSIP